MAMKRENRLLMIRQSKHSLLLQGIAGVALSSVSVAPGIVP